MLKILDRVLVVLGALLLMQFPLFMHQYKLQLMGHVAELQWQVEKMKDAAAQTDKSLDSYIKKFVTSEDKDFANQGKVMQLVHLRWQKFSTSLSALENATVLTRPFLFSAYFSYEIFKSTLQSFEMGIPFSLEGLIYGCLGMFLGYLIFRFIINFVNYSKKYFILYSNSQRFVKIKNYDK